jgi:hypothetical protein
VKTAGLKKVGIVISKLIYNIFAGNIYFEVSIL